MIAAVTQHHRADLIAQRDRGGPVAAVWAIGAPMLTETAARRGASGLDF